MLQMKWMTQVCDRWRNLLRRGWPQVTGRPRLAFIYGSRESVWPGIAPHLLTASDAVRDIVQRCDSEIQDRLGWSVVQELSAPQITSEDRFEPALTTIQIALTEAWRELGVEADAIGARCGGEFAAAYASGILHFEDAVELACRVSRLFRDGKGAGRLLATPTSVLEIQALQHLSPVVFHIAADTADGGSVLACATEAADALRTFLHAHGVSSRVTPTAAASHSPFLSDCEAELMRPLNPASLTTHRPAYYSGQCGRVELFPAGPLHWWHAVRQPTFMAKMHASMIQDGCNVFVEIGGAPSLAKSIQRQADALGKKVLLLSSMQRNQALMPVITAAHTQLKRLRLDRPAAPVRGGESAKSVPRFDLASDALIQDPYPTYAALRRHAPIYFDETQGAWLVSRFADIAHVLKEADAFSSRNASIENTLAGADGQDHARVRKLLNHDFSPGQARRIADLIRVRVDALFDSMTVGAPCDFMSTVATVLPRMLTLEMLGIDAEPAETLQRWSDALFETDRDLLPPLVEELRGYFQKFLQHKPRVGLFKTIYSAQEKDPWLSNARIVELGMVLLVAGLETVTDSIGNAIHMLLRRPDIAGHLRVNPQCIPAFNEEVLRLESPVQRIDRITTRPVVLGGRRLPKETRIVLLLGSANRDAEKFKDADEFRMDREPNAHLAFGLGKHYCLGAPLSRIQSQIVVETFLRRMPDAMLVEPVEYRSSYIVRGPARMRLKYER